MLLKIIIRSIDVFCLLAYLMFLQCYVRYGVLLHVNTSWINLS